MLEVPNDVAVAQDSRAGRAALDPMDWDKTMVGQYLYRWLETDLGLDPITALAWSPVQ